VIVLALFAPVLVGQRKYAQALLNYVFMGNDRASVVSEFPANILSKINAQISAIAWVPRQFDCSAYIAEVECGRRVQARLLCKHDILHSLNKLLLSFIMLELTPSPDSTIRPNIRISIV
jgi:hypothetical protein